MPERPTERGSIRFAVVRLHRTQENAEDEPIISTLAALEGRAVISRPDRFSARSFAGIPGNEN